ncbi:MAG: zf-HC2 domain-containing protein [Anaerolineae bacterium]|jgi:hypothetical protein|nr:zf-HC2 domain-containing protein [Anaerolineae bacterium]
MNHQTYEEWALMPEYLSPEEKQALEAHQKECESCRELAKSWAKVEGFLLDAKPVEPAPGFTTRFAASLAERKAKEHKKQVWKFLAILAVILLLSMSVVSIFYYATNSPVVVIEGIFKTGARLVTIWESVKAIARSISSLTPIAMLLPILFIGAIMLTGMTGVWLATIWKFALVKGKVK